jgi:hypothetical protein
MTPSSQIVHFIVTANFCCQETRRTCRLAACQGCQTFTPFWTRQIQNPVNCGHLAHDLYSQGFKLVKERRKKNMRPCQSVIDMNAVQELVQELKRVIKLQQTSAAMRVD